MWKEGGVSHDTLNDVMNTLPDDLFTECFTNWVVALRDGNDEIVAIDGSRRAHGTDGWPLHIVSAGAGSLRCKRERNQYHATSSQSLGTERRGC